MHRCWFTMQNVILIWVVVEKDFWKTLKEGPALRSQGGAVACVPGRPYPLLSPESKWNLNLHSSPAPLLPVVPSLEALHVLLLLLLQDSRLRGRRQARLQKFADSGWPQPFSKVLRTAARIHSCFTELC